jgi:hypothetical protein
MGLQNSGHPENQRLVIYSSTRGGYVGRGGNSKIAGAAMERSSISAKKFRNCRDLRNRKLSELRKDEIIGIAVTCLAHSRPFFGCADSCADSLGPISVSFTALVMSALGLL